MKATKASKKPTVIPPGRAPHWLIVPGLLVLTLAAYANSFEAGFALDNKGLVLEDPRLRALTAENLGLILHKTYWWPYGEAGLYRPFTTLTYLFNYTLLGNATHAAGYHVVNLLLHALNVLLVYILARRFLPGLWPPAAVAGLWAVHPALTESVTNIVGRSDLLAGAAILGGFWLYLKSTEASGSRRITWLGGLAAVTTIGVFSKENAVAILAVMAFYDFLWWKSRKGFGALLPDYAAVLLPTLAMLWIRAGVTAASPPAVFAFTDNPLVGAGFRQAKLTALAVLGRYMWLTLWPMHLASDYSYAQIPLASGSLLDWAAWLTVAATLALAVFLFMKNRAAVFFLLFAFVNIAPVANLLVPIGTIMADRLLYLPSIGICACVVIAVYSLPIAQRSPVAAILVLALVAAAWGTRTFVRNAAWRDDLTLATDEVNASPASYKAHFYLANSLYDTDSGRATLDRVIDEIDKSLSIVDSLPDARKPPHLYSSAGNYYMTKGYRLLGHGPDNSLIDTPESREAYQKSVQLLQQGLAIEAALRGPGAVSASAYEAEVRRMLSIDYLRLSEIPQAQQEALEARRLDPLDPRNYWQLFNVLVTEERASEAATVLLEGGIATGDQSMRQELIRLYRLGLDEKGCAVDPATGVINPSCDMVHRQICAAVADLQQLAREAPQTGLAGRMTQAAATGCTLQNH